MNMHIAIIHYLHLHSELLWLFCDPAIWFVMRQSSKGNVGWASSFEFCWAWQWEVWSEVVGILMFTAPPFIFKMHVYLQNKVNGFWTLKLNFKNSDTLHKLLLLSATILPMLWRRTFWTPLLQSHAAAVPAPPILPNHKVLNTKRSGFCECTAEKKGSQINCFVSEQYL